MVQAIVLVCHTVSGTPESTRVCPLSTIMSCELQVLFTDGGWCLLATVCDGLSVLFQRIFTVYISSKTLRITPVNSIRRTITVIRESNPTPKLQRSFSCRLS